MTFEVDTENVGQSDPDQQIHVWRWALRICIWSLVLISLYFGISLFTLPKAEVTYSLSESARICLHSSCTVAGTLKIGNTGSEIQSGLIIDFDSRFSTLLLNQPSLLESGVRKREIEVSQTGGTYSVAFNTLEPTKRVDLKFMLHSSDDIPPIRSLFVGIRGVQGSLQEGDPEVVRFGRFLVRFIGL